MDVEVKSGQKVSKGLYKAVLYSLKIIPMLIAAIYLLNMVLSYYDIDLPILSYIVFLLLLVFLYIASYAFKFCEYHRVFLHYIAFNTLVSSIDYIYGIPIDNWELFVMYLIATGIFLFMFVYFKINNK